MEVVQDGSVGRPWIHPLPQDTPNLQLHEGQFPLKTSSTAPQQQRICRNAVSPKTPSPAQRPTAGGSHKQGASLWRERGLYLTPGTPTLGPALETDAPPHVALNTNRTHIPEGVDTPLFNMFSFLFCGVMLSLRHTRLQKGCVGFGWAKRADGDLWGEEEPRGEARKQCQLEQGLNCEPERGPPQNKRDSLLRSRTRREMLEGGRTGWLSSQRIHPERARGQPHLPQDRRQEQWARRHLDTHETLTGQPCSVCGRDGGLQGWRHQPASCVDALSTPRAPGDRPRLHATPCPC